MSRGKYIKIVEHYQKRVKVYADEGCEDNAIFNLFRQDYYTDGVCSLEEMPRWDSKRRIPRGELSHLII